jgi:glyoxylase-like metal-dependent hydrolase (beta-lactamase superfamily II)
MNVLMSSECFRFSLGDFECWVINDGTYTYPYPAQNTFINFFVNAPPGLLKMTLNKYGLDPEQWEQYVSPYPCLAINTGQHFVLVDTGAGSFSPTTGKLVPNLREESIQPKDIDIVILTHGHPDHIGGNLDKEGNSTFRNARYVIQKEEWDFWASKPHLDNLRISEHGKDLLIKVAQDNLLPLRDQIDFINYEAEIIPGIRGIPAPGHTPGHMVVEVCSGSDQLLYISDTVLHPIHLEEPDWYSAVAINPHRVVATRRRILAMASKEHVFTLASHFPFPGLGHIIPKGERWRWQPV